MAALRADCARCGRPMEPAAIARHRLVCYDCMPRSRCGRPFATLPPAEQFREIAHSTYNHALRRAKLDVAEGPVPFAVWWEMLRTAPAACPFCLRAWGPDRKPGIGRIVPLARGGSNARDNLTIQCYRCNGRQYTRTLAELPPKGDGFWTGL